MTTMHIQPATAGPQWLTKILTEADLPVAENVTRLQGRNDNYRVETTAGTFFVKRLVGPAVNDRYCRSLAYATTFAATSIPELVHASELTSTLVFRELPGSVSGNELLVQERFTPAVCANVGTHLARLHAAPITAGSARPGLVPTLPTPGALTALPLEAVNRFSAGEVEAWRLIHADDTLIARLVDLGEQTARAPRTWTHGDFRIDQVLVSDGRAHIVDWEEFGTGDPAHDTGNWIGEWVYRAALDIPTARGDGIGTGEVHGVLAHRSLSSQEIIRRGASKLDALSPQMVAFWDAYQRERDVTATELARTVSFAGWHLVERLLALAQVKATLPGVTRAAAGIGKRLLTHPSAAAEALGLSVWPPTTGAVA